MVSTVKRGFDDFLDYSSKGGKSGGYLGGWKKNKDDEHGEITVWMHVGFMPAPFWCHPIYAVIEMTKEDKLIVVPRRWTCHESNVMVNVRDKPVSNAALQKWRNEDGTAEHTPTVCPMCILTSVIARLVDKGEIGFTDVVFEWNGTEDTVQILAGGIYGHFRKKKGLTRDQQNAMRKAKVRQDEAFKHDMRTGLKYLFGVLDDAHPERGLVTTVESEGLSNKVRAAFFAEGEIVQAKTKIDMRDERVRGQWDPSITPYSLIWKYDGTKDFDDKFTVVPIRGGEMPDAVKAIIVDGELPDTSDLEPGNCHVLRAELEAHCKVDLPWDEIFGPAAEAGLMKPLGESKEEVEEDAHERTPEVRTKETKDGPVLKGEVVPLRVGPDHAAWKNKGYKPSADFKGTEVHLLPPGEATDADVTRVTKLFATVAKVVAEVVSCEHCSEEMTTVDVACPTCGAEYDEDGNLKTRPCLSEGCGKQVDLDGEGPKYMCGSCSSIHEIVLPAANTGDAETWTLVEAKPPRAASTRRTRSGGRAPTPF